jgi:hypothetical protein
MLKRVTYITMALGLALAGPACEKEPSGTRTGTKTATKTETTTAGGEKTTETKTTVTKFVVNADVGVAECDEYVRKMSACSMKLAADAAGTMMESTAAMKKAWKDAAAVPDTKVALASGCKQALDTARNAYASSGCEF